MSVLDISTFNDEEILTEIERRLAMKDISNNIDMPNKDALTPRDDKEVLSMNWDAFGESIEKSKTKPLGSVFEKKEQARLEDIVNAFLAENYSLKTDLDFLSYACATVRIECGGSMNVNVREGFKKTDAAARAHVKSKGRSYAKEVVVDDKGTTQVFYGRGPCQLTHDYNYKRVGKEFGIGDELFKNPDMALDDVFGYQILFRGQAKGWFNGRGKGLAYYLRDMGDYKGAYEARRTINVTNRADLIARWHFDFLEAFKKAIK